MKNRKPPIDPILMGRDHTRGIKSPWGYDTVNNGTYDVWHDDRSYLGQVRPVVVTRLPTGAPTRWFEAHAPGGVSWDETPAFPRRQHAAQWLLERAEKAESE